MTEIPAFVIRTSQPVSPAPFKYQSPTPRLMKKASEVELEHYRGSTDAYALVRSVGIRVPVEIESRELCRHSVV